MPAFPFELARHMSPVRKSMRSIRAAIGATIIDPKLLTDAERLQYEGYLHREYANAVARLHNLTPSANADSITCGAGWHRDPSPVHSHSRQGHRPNLAKESFIAIYYVRITHTFYRVSEPNETVHNALILDLLDDCGMLQRMLLVPFSGTDRLAVQIFPGVRSVSI